MERTFELLVLLTDGSVMIVPNVTKYGHNVDIQSYYFIKDDMRHFLSMQHVIFIGKNEYFDANSDSSCRISDTCIFSANRESGNVRRFVKTLLERVENKQKEYIDRSHRQDRAFDPGIQDTYDGAITALTNMISIITELAEDAGIDISGAKYEQTNN